MIRIQYQSSGGAGGGGQELLHADGAPGPVDAHAPEVGPSSFIYYYC